MSESSDRDDSADTAVQRRKLRRWQIAVVGMLYICYVGVLMNRRGISVTAPTMRNDTSLAYTTGDLGILLAIGNGAHLVSELFAGPITDAVGGRPVFMVCTFGPAVMTTLFSFMRSLPWWGVCWALNRMFQAAVFPAMAKLISAWFPPSEYGRAVGILSSASRVGAASAGLVMGTLLTQLHMTWYEVLLAAAVFLAVFSILGWFLVKSEPESVGLSLALIGVVRTSIDGTQTAVAAATSPARDKGDDQVRLLEEDDTGDQELHTGKHGSNDADTQSTSLAVSLPTPAPARVPLSARCSAGAVSLAAKLRRFATEPRFWFVCMSTGCIWMLFEFDSYVPVYLADNVGIEPGQASLAGAAFPIGMIISTIGGGFALDKLTRRQGNILIFVSMCCNIAVVVTLWVLTATATVTLLSALALAFLFGLSLGLPAYMPNSLFALRFGGKKDCATLLALIDVFGWGAIITLDLATRSLASSVDEGGWTSLFTMMVVVGTLGVVVLGIFMILDTRAAARDEAALAASAALTAPSDDKESGVLVGVTRVSSDSMRRRSVELKHVTGADRYDED